MTTYRKFTRDQLKVGDVLNNGAAIVIDIGPWWKHPRYSEFEQREKARGFAVAELWGRGWHGPHEDKWRPGVWQITDVHNLNGVSIFVR